MGDEFLAAGVADARMRHRWGRVSWFCVWMEGEWNWVNKGAHNGRWVVRWMGRKAVERCGVVEGSVKTEKLGRNTLRINRHLAGEADRLSLVLVCG